MPTPAAVLPPGANMSHPASAWSTCKNSALSSLHQAIACASFLFASFVLQQTLSPAPLFAQDTVNLNQFRSCTCALKPLIHARLGDNEGSGTIDSETMGLVFEPRTARYAAFPFAAPKVSFFDNRGRFLIAYGRMGSGPGELRNVVAAQASDRGVVTLDAGNLKWVVLSANGELLSERRLSLRPGPFIVTGDSIDLAVFDRRPAAVGFPLHRLTLTGDTAVKHYGSLTGEYSLASVANQVMVSSDRDRRGTWIAFPNRLEFQLWTLNGDLIQVVTGAPDWFPPVRQWARPGQPPDTRLGAFGIDSDKRLWVISQVADARWREAREGPVSREGAVIRDANLYRDSRLDVFDLRTREHLGTYTWDSASVQLLKRVGELGVYLVEFDKDSVPTLAVYGIQFVRQPT
jgi:hypothetical protein